MKEIKVNIKNAPYSVIIDELREIGSHNVALREKISQNKALIITNPTIAALYLPKILPLIGAKEIFICTIRDGEQFKNMQSIEQILNFAFDCKLDRNSLFIALGGGVISDMTGFAAGIYKRGVDFISIPTTLLSQVDASVGGKTGVNNTFGKNLIGIFNQPKAVYIDINFLSTLPKRELISGISEIIKMAVCFDGEFFEWLLSADLLGSKADLERAIFKSVEIKAKVVESDERERGVRAALNYGHTFGHIIELLGDYKVHLHGESVSIGMVFANKLSLKLGKITQEQSDKIRQLLEKYDLPTHYKVSDTGDFYDKMLLDKKAQNGDIKFIIPSLNNGKIGGFEIVSKVPKELVCEVLNEE